MILNLFIRIERDRGEFLLRLEAILRMMPYFVAAIHQNYSRWAPIYLEQMKNMAAEIFKHFCGGEHVAQLQKGGIWNGI